MVSRWPRLDPARRQQQQRQLTATTPTRAFRQPLEHQSTIELVNTYLQARQRSIDSNNDSGVNANSANTNSTSHNNNVLRVTPATTNNEEQHYTDDSQHSQWSQSSGKSSSPQYCRRAPQPQPQPAATAASKWCHALAGNQSATTTEAPTTVQDSSSGKQRRQVKKSASLHLHQPGIIATHDGQQAATNQLNSNLSQSHSHGLQQQQQTPPTNQSNSKPSRWTMTRPQIERTHTQMSERQSSLASQRYLNRSDHSSGSLAGTGGPMGGADGDLDDGTRCLQFSKKLALGLLLSLVIAVCWLLVIHSLKWVAMYGHAPHTHHYTHRPWPAPSSATLSWLPRTPTTTMTHDSAMGVSSTTEEGGTPPSSPLQDNERGEGGVTEVSMTRVQRDNYSDNKKNMVAKRLVAAVDSGNNDDNEDDDLVNTFVTAEHVHSFTTTQATLPTHRQRGLNEQSQQSLPRTTTMFGENNNNKVKKITTSTSNRPTEPDVVPSLRLSSIILGPTKPATTTTDQHNNQNNDANNNPRHNSNNNNNQEDHLDEILTRHNSKHDTEDITTATTAVTVTSALDNTISSDDLHNSARDTDNLSLSNNPNNDDSADNHSANAQHHKIHRRPRTHSSHIRYEAPFFTAWFCSVWNILFMPMFTLISTCCFRHEDTTTRKLVAESITQFMDHGLTSMQFIGRCAFFSLLWMATIYGLISSMAHIDATVVMSLFACSAIFVYILSWVVLHQQFVGVRIVAVIICTTGIALLAYMDNSHKTLGSVLVVTGSALSSAIYKVFYQRMFGFWSVAQMSLFFTLIGFLNAFLMWPIVLVLYFTGTEIIIWRDIPWLHLVAAGFLYLLADVVAYFGPICTYEVFLTFGLLLAVVMSAIVDVTYYKVTFAGMKLAGVLLLMIGFLVCLLPYNWNEFLCDMVNARIANWKKQRSLKKSRNKVQDLTTGHVSRLRTPSGRVK